MKVNIKKIALSVKKVKSTNLSQEKQLLMVVFMHIKLKVQIFQGKVKKR